MNTLISKTLIFGFCSVSLLPGQSIEEEWSVVLVQKHLATVGTFQQEVAMEGSQVSFAPIPKGGSEFNLWAFRDGPDGVEEHHIETEFVDAYLPKGEIWITTPDSYSGGIPRTRIDQGFTVNTDVSGLLSGESDPAAARKVLMDHKVAVGTRTSTVTGAGAPIVPVDGVESALPYNPEPTSAPTVPVVETNDYSLGTEIDVEQSFIEVNGVRSSNRPVNPTHFPDVFQSSGVETFKLFALSDGQVADLELSSAQVQVWPLAQATFSGISESLSYSNVPGLTIDLVNLYPQSETWVQVYSGTTPPVTNGTRLTEVPAFIIDGALPRDTQMVFQRLDDVISSSGVWTIEVITETPFGAEVIESVTITIDRNLQLRGSFQALAE